MKMIVFVAVITLLVASVYLWFRKKFKFWKSRGFPSITPTIPLGSVAEMGFKTHTSELFKRFYDEKKGQAPAVGMYFLTQPVLMPLEPELVKDILVRNFDNFRDRGFYLNKKDDPLSAHLFSLEGSEWKNMRAKLTPTFTSGKMKMMFGTLSKVADGMIDYLAKTVVEKTDVEMKELLSQFTTEVISSVAFGIETKCIDNPKSEFRRLANRVFDPPKWETVKFLFMNAFQDLSKKLGLTFNNQESTDFFLGIIKSTVKYREENNVERNDFLQLLLQIKNGEDGSGMTINDMAAQSFVFFLAGFETSSSTMTFILYELALNQDIQERLRDEIQEVIADNDNQITYEAIMQMKYLDMVFNETLRKYPIVDTQFRKANKAFKIPDSSLVIPEGTTIIISAYALHHDERFYVNPSQFDPERFTVENAKARHPFCYIPFGEGPRVCIGLRFGIMQSKIGLVKLLTNYRFTICEKSPVPMELNPSTPFMAPLNGMFLKLETLK